MGEAFVSGRRAFNGLTTRPGINVRMDSEIETVIDRRPHSETYRQYFLTRRAQPEENKPIVANSLDLEFSEDKNGWITITALDPQTIEEPSTAAPLELIAIQKARGPMANAIRRRIKEAGTQV